MLVHNTDAYQNINEALHGVSDFDAKTEAIRALLDAVSFANCLGESPSCEATQSNLDGALEHAREQLCIAFQLNI